MTLDDVEKVVAATRASARVRPLQVGLEQTVAALADERDAIRARALGIVKQHRSDYNGKVIDTLLFDLESRL